MKSDVRKEYDRYKKNLSRTVKARKKTDRDNIGIDGRKKCKKCNIRYSESSLIHLKLKITDSLLCEKCDEVLLKNKLLVWSQKEEKKQGLNGTRSKVERNNDGSITQDGKKWYFHPFYGFRRNKTRGKYIRQRQ